MSHEVSPEQAAQALVEVRYRQRQVRATGPNRRLALLAWAALDIVVITPFDFAPRSVAFGLAWCLAVLGCGLSAWYGARGRRQVRPRHNNPWPLIFMAAWVGWTALLQVTASVLHVRHAFPYPFTVAAVLDALPLALYGLRL